MESRSDGRQSPRPSGRGNSAEISAKSPARDDRNSSQVYVSSLRGLSLDFTDFPRAYAQYRSMERRKSLNNTRPTRKRGNPNRKHISFPRLRFGLMLKYPIERYWDKRRESERTSCHPRTVIPSPRPFPSAVENPSPNPLGGSARCAGPPCGPR